MVLCLTWPTCARHVARVGIANLIANWQAEAIKTEEVWEHNEASCCAT